MQVFENAHAITIHWATLLIAAVSLPGVDIIRVRAIAVVVLRLQRGDLRLDRVQALNGLAQRGGHQLLAFDPHAPELIFGLQEWEAGERRENAMDSEREIEIGCEKQNSDKRGGKRVE